MAGTGPVRLPYGDAFLVETPSLDRYSQQLHLEERQRNLLRQQQQKQLDDDLAKNLSNVRDKDVPDITKAYGDWKLAQQAAMKQKEGVSPDQQLELLRKKSEIYKLINASKAELATEQQRGTQMAAHPELYSDNASNLLSERRKLPMSQFSTYKDANGNPIDLSDWGNFMYKGTDTDFQKILNSAYGTPKQVYQAEEPVGKDNLQTKITPYLYGNTPAQVKDSIMQSLALRKAGRDAEAMVKSIDPAILNEIDKEFKAIPADRWKQMGVDKPQDLSIDKATSKAEQFAIHQAQLYALNNEPKQGTPVFRTNESAKENLQFQRQLYLNNYEHSLKQGDDAQAGLGIDKYVGDITNQAKHPENLYVYSQKDGGTINAYKVQLDPTLNKALGFDEKNQGTLLVTDDGKYIVAPYKMEAKTTQKDGVTTTSHKPIQENGSYAIDTERSAQISADQLKLALGKQAGVKLLNLEMTKQPTSKSNYTIKGKTYSEKQLLDMGYTIDQITPFKNK